MFIQQIIISLNTRSIKYSIQSIKIIQLNAMFTQLILFLDFNKCKSFHIYKIYFAVQKVCQVLAIISSQ